MKLIDLLVKELPKRGGWPEGAKCAWQDWDKQVRPESQGFGFYANELADNHRRRYEVNPEPGDDNCVTLSQYESALAKNDDRLGQDLNECIGQDVDMPEWNGEGLPPIGCACEMQDSKGTWLPVEIIAKNDGFTFGWSYDYRIVLFGDKADEFRPLRAEGEGAREKLAASLHIAAGASPIELNGMGPLYFKLADAIISGSVFGTTFKADK